MFFSRLHVLAQHGVNGALITPSMLAKECQHVRIDAQSNLLFRSWPDDGVCKKIRAKLRAIGEVDVLIPHCVNPLPVRPGSFFRILCVLHDRSTSEAPRV